MSEQSTSDIERNLSATSIYKNEENKVRNGTKWCQSRRPHRRLLCDIAGLVPRYHYFCAGQFTTGNTISITATER